MGLYHPEVALSHRLQQSGGETAKQFPIQDSRKIHHRRNQGGLKRRLDRQINNQSPPASPRISSPNFKYIPDTCPTNSIFVGVRGWSQRLASHRSEMRLKTFRRQVAAPFQAHGVTGAVDTEPPRVHTLPETYTATRRTTWTVWRVRLYRYCNCNISCRWRGNFLNKHRSRVQNKFVRNNGFLIIRFTIFLERSFRCGSRKIKRYSRISLAKTSSNGMKLFSTLVPFTWALQAETKENKFGLFCCL